MIENINKLQAGTKNLLKAAVLPALRARFRREMESFSKPYKLHLGCGSHHLDDWVNIDFINTPAVDVYWNLGQPIPLSNDTCSYIFHEHVLEHFKLKRGIDLLKECYRVLKPGGVLRVAMPSLDEMIDNCNTGEWATKESPHMPKVQTRAEYMNIMFRHWGHEWIYDHDELQRRLRQAGFSLIVNVERHESVHEALRQIEYRADSFLVCEATK